MHVRMLLQLLYCTALGGTFCIQGGDIWLSCETTASSSWVDCSVSQYTIPVSAVEGCISLPHVATCLCCLSLAVTTGLSQQPDNIQAQCWVHRSAGLCSAHQHKTQACVCRGSCCCLWHLAPALLATTTLHATGSWLTTGRLEYAILL